MRRRGRRASARSPAGFFSWCVSELKEGRGGGGEGHGSIILPLLQRVYHKLFAYPPSLHPSLPPSLSPPLLPPLPPNELHAAVAPVEGAGHVVALGITDLIPYPVGRAAWREGGRMGGVDERKNARKGRRDVPREQGGLPVPLLEV